MRSPPGSRRRGRPTAWPLLPALLLVGACTGEAGASPNDLPAPAEVVDLAGLEAALAAHRGQGQLVNFWAIWCAPCVAELPDLEEVAGEYRDRGGRVVAVSYDLMVPVDSVEAKVAEVEEFWARNGYSSPVLIYDADDYDAINARFGLLGGIPATLAINAAGEIVDREENRAGVERFREMMEAALRR